MFTIKRFNASDSGTSHSASATTPTKHTSFLSKLNKAAKKRLEERTGTDKKKDKKKKKKKSEKEKSSKKKKVKKDTNVKKRKKMGKLPTTETGTDSDVGVEAVPGKRDETPQKRRRAQVNPDADDKIEETKIGASLLSARNLLQGWKTRNFAKKNAAIGHKTPIPNSAGTLPGAKATDAQRWIQLVTFTTRSEPTKCVFSHGIITSFHSAEEKRSQVFSSLHPLLQKQMLDRPEFHGLFPIQELAIPAILRSLSTLV